MTARRMNRNEKCRLSTKGLAHSAPSRCLSRWAGRVWVVMEVCTPEGRGEAQENVLRQQPASQKAAPQEEPGPHGQGENTEEGQGQTKPQPCLDRFACTGLEGFPT